MAHQYCRSQSAASGAPVVIIRFAAAASASNVLSAATCASMKCLRCICLRACIWESQLFLLQQQQLFVSSLWISRLLYCPLGLVLRGLSLTDADDSDSFMELETPHRRSWAQWEGPRGPRETVRFLYDSFFAQMLRAQRGVLWGSGGNCSSSGKGEVDLCLRQKEVDLGCPGLSASGYADFDLLESQKPITNPGIYRAICYSLSLGDSVIKPWTISLKP